MPDRTVTEEKPQTSRTPAPGPAPAPEPPARDLPPGPKGRWLVGNGLDLRRDQMGFFTRMQREHGNAVTINLGRGGRLFLFSAPEAIERILVVNAANYTSREVNLPSMPFLGDGLLNIDGDFHHAQRALVQPALSRRRVESYADVMLGYTETMLAAWAADQVVDMHLAMQQLTLRIVARALFGVDLADASGPFGRAFNAILDYDEDHGLLPKLRLDLPFTAYGRYQRARRFLDREIFALVAARHQVAAEDVMTTLLQTGLQDRQVRDHTITLLAAGHETTSNLLTFTFHLLSRNPAQRGALQAELARVLAGRRPSLADLPDLPLLDMVIKESLRLYPPAWVIGRRARADDAVLGHRLPAGAFALMSQWVVHRRPDLWPHADEFLPERFTQPVSPFAYFPFGGGPRTCIGMPFAQQEAKLILAAILQRYVPELVPGQRLVLEPRVTLRPAGGTYMRLLQAAA